MSRTTLFLLIAGLCLAGASCSDPDDSASGAHLLAFNAYSGKELWDSELSVALVSNLRVNGNELTVTGGHACDTSDLTVIALSVSNGKEQGKQTVSSPHGACVREQPEIESDSMKFSRELGSGDLIAHNKATGANAWRRPFVVERPDIVAGGGSTVAYSFGNYHFFRTNPQAPESTSETRTVVILDAETGQELWRIVEESSYGAGPPEQVRVFVDSAAVYVMYLVHNPDTGSNDRPQGRLDAFEPMTGELLWSFTNEVLTQNVAVASDEEHLLVANHRAVLMLGRGDGEIAWSHDINPPAFSVEVEMSNGTAFVATSVEPEGLYRD